MIYTNAYAYKRGSLMLRLRSLIVVAIGFISTVTAVGGFLLMFSINGEKENEPPAVVKSATVSGTDILGIGVALAEALNSYYGFYDGVDEV